MNDDRLKAMLLECVREEHKTALSAMVNRPTPSNIQAFEKVHKRLFKIEDKAREKIKKKIALVL